MRLSCGRARVPQSGGAAAVSAYSGVFGFALERERTRNPHSMERTGVRWNERPLCRLFDMTTDTKEQRLLWEAALRAIGRALKHEFENERQEVPDRISRLLVELEAKGKTTRED